MYPKKNSLRPFLTLRRARLTLLRLRLLTLLNLRLSTSPISSAIAPAVSPASALSKQIAVSANNCNERQRGHRRQF